LEIFWSVTSLDSWNKATWRFFFVPGGIVLLAATFLLRTGWLTLTLPFLTFLYYAGLLLGLLLAWKFHSSRAFFALLVLFLAQQAITVFAGLGPVKAPRHAALETVVWLVPLNLVLLSLSRERTLTLSATGWTLTFLFAQATIVAAVARAGENSEVPLRATRHALSLLSSPHVWTIFGMTALLLLLRFALTHKPVDSALFWSFGAYFMAVHSGGAGRVATGYFAASTLILAVSIIETSYLLAYHDELTTLPSRRAFKETLLRLDPPYSIAMVDIDHFKHFNDTYGHDTGDEVLRLVATSLARVTGGGRAYRCGDEEFAIVFSGKTTSEVFEHLERLRTTIESSSFRLRGSDRRQLPRGTDRRSQRLRSRGGSGRAIRQLVRAQGNTLLSVTVSIGVAAATEERAIPDRVVQAADKALYRAKAGGRNRVETASAKRRSVRTKAAGIA
jgi:diguanylate cyclase (GGDEF)-like protein